MQTLADPRRRKLELVRVHDPIEARDQQQTTVPNVAVHNAEDEGERHAGKKHRVHLLVPGRVMRINLLSVKITRLFESFLCTELPE